MTKQVRGFRALVEEFVDHGSKAVEEMHKTATARTFYALEAYGPTNKPARLVHRAHDASLSGMYGLVRLVNRTVGKALDGALVLAERSLPDAHDAHASDAHAAQ
jgi:tRNA A37 N6-isopentenylltransferase MiaA